jgi:hypothetical protein
VIENRKNVALRRNSKKKICAAYKKSIKKYTEKSIKNNFFVLKNALLEKSVFVCYIKKKVWQKNVL